MTEQKAPRRPSKKEHAARLLEIIDKAMKAGATAEEAIEQLTVKQYDFLIEYGVNLDSLLLTAEQQTAIKEITKAPRKLSPNGYNKKYPQSKQELYSTIVEHLTAQGATIEPREKQNYRDLDFTLAGVKYKIVLSNPRPPKKN
jgi:beta-galactosidase GanA